MELTDAAPRLVCPRCHAALERLPDADTLVCRSGEHRWPIVAGIPDLRTEHDPFLSIDDDARAATALAEHARSASFAETLASYYEHNTLVPATQARRIVRATLAAAERARAFFAQGSALAGFTLDPASQVLDLGAGTAPLSVELARQGAAVWAIDVGLRWLTLARARAVGASTRVQLAGAAASALPFADASFDLVVAESVFELVTDSAAALRDVRRVLRPGGVLILATPNRWSPGPDPHLGIPFGAWLPEAGVRTIARLRGILPPRRSLFSGRSLRTALHATGFTDERIDAVDVPLAIRQQAPAWLRWGAAAYDAVRAIPAMGRAALWLTPTLIATARKPPNAR